jgi:hypothetical protein
MFVDESIYSSQLLLWVDALVVVVVVVVLLQISVAVVAVSYDCGTSWSVA